MWSKARKETRQMCLGSSDMVVAAACMGWQEKRKTWVCRRRLDQGINHRLWVFCVPLVVGTTGGGF